MTRRRLQDMAAWMLATVTTAAQAGSPYPTVSETHDYSGAYRLKADTAWQLGATGQGTVVAVIDTGVNAAHPDLTGQVLTGYNALSGSTATGDGNGHGTHVAGILGAASNGRGIVGIAYDTKILPVKIFDANGYGTDASLSAGIRYTYGKAKILNLSLGANGPVSEAALRGAVSRGQLIVAAAGNGGLSNTNWPARYAPQSWANGQILAVGAVDANNRITAWSNRAGVTRYYYLVAPATSVLSTYKSGYAYMSGTSMATPVVSGAAALVWSAWPYLTARQVANSLLRTATDLGAVGVDAVYGRGLVNLERAMQPIGTTAVKTASLSTGTAFTSSTTTSISSLSSWHAGPAYAANLYDFARQGGLTASVVDELGRDFQTDLGVLVAAPGGMRLETMFGQMEQQMTLTDRVLADGSRLTLAPSAQASPDSRMFDADYIALIPGGFALTTQLADGDAWGVGINGFADRFFGLGAARFAGAPMLDAPALTDPLFGLVPRHSHLGYVFGFDHGIRVRVGLLSDGMNRLYDAEADTHAPGSSSLWTTEFSQQTAARYLSVSVSQLREDSGLLGSRQDELFGLNSTAITTAVSVQGAWRLAPGLALAGRYTLGHTPAMRADGDTLLGEVSDVRTDAFALGLVRADAWRSGDRLSLSMSQPLRARAGTMKFHLPTGNDSDGRMQYTARALELGSRARELRTELNYTTPLGPQQELGIALAHRVNPDHAEDAEDDRMFAVRWQLQF